ncbi:MAG: alpha-amylase [Chloroflexi bacterium]|nr:alpha-amylase [Chloroflexota bacterium]
MTPWPAKPFIYEINTWVWLNTLSRRYQQPITLGTVPDAVLDELAATGLDAVWLMGVWQRSAEARRSALNYKHEYAHALPDLSDEDVIGSAYAIYAYEVEPLLGGRAELAALRERLQARGLRLMLDFVPNHTSADSLWLREHPGYFVQGTPRDLSKRGDMFFSTLDHWGRTTIVAHGRDPYFPPWIDTAQLNAFDADYRRQTIQTLSDIAAQCDGVRCDMAMLMLNSIFGQTWIGHVDDAPETEYWAEVISHVKDAAPDFLFIAEAYWGLEFTLQQQGFDYTYDKVLYDRIAEGSIEKVYDHLNAIHEFQKRSVRFVENHDEPRANAHFGEAKTRAATALICTLPGMALLHDGQLEGRRVKLPVQLARQPEEALNGTLRSYYQALLQETRAPIYQQGEWQLFDMVNGGLLAYGWRSADAARLIIVNLKGEAQQGIVNLGGWDWLSAATWELRSVLGSSRTTRAGKELVKSGLAVEVEPYTAIIYHVERA